MGKFVFAGVLVLAATGFSRAQDFNPGTVVGMSSRIRRPAAAAAMATGVSTTELLPDPEMRVYPYQLRRRHVWHHGAAPTAH